MSLDGAAFSPKEFGLAIQTEGTIGTKLVSGMNRMNVDSVEMPSFNLTQVLEARSGSSGRLTDTEDVFIDDKGTVKEISFSGILDTVTASLLLPNVLTTALDTSSNIITVPITYSATELETGAASGIHKSFTVAILSPSTGSNRMMIFKGCVVSQLTITGDMTNESGRLRYSCTMRSGYKAEYNSTATVSTDYGGTFYSLASLAGAKTIAGAANSVIQSFSLNIENPAEFVGQSNTDGDPEAIVRSIPELAITLDATVKYDNNTAGLMNTMQSKNVNSSTNSLQMGTLLCTHATLLNSSTSFGFEAPHGQITSVGFNEANAMMIDVSSKFVANPKTAADTDNTTFFAIHI